MPTCLHHAELSASSHSPPNLKPQIIAENFNGRCAIQCSFLLSFSADLPFSRAWLGQLVQVMKVILNRCSVQSIGRTEIVMSMMIPAHMVLRVRSIGMQMVVFWSTIPKLIQGSVPDTLFCTDTSWTLFRNSIQLLLPLMCTVFVLCLFFKEERKKENHSGCKCELCMGPLFQKAIRMPTAALGQLSCDSWHQ
jgi:hypothetical protein